MSAHDTFEWYVSTQASPRNPDEDEFIRGLREYLFALRSEDERQRYVEWAIEEVRERFAAAHQARAPRRGFTG